MTLEAIFLYQAPGVLLGFLLGLSLVIFFSKRRTVDDNVGEKNPVGTTLEVIKSRRTITPKDLSGESLTQAEVDQLLEAANWAPTHKKTEPW